MGIKDSVRDGFKEWLEDPDNSETVNSLKQLEGSDEFIEKFMTDDEFTQAVIDGSYPKGLFGIPTEEGIVKIATDIVEMAERNGGTFEPLLSALEENREEVLDSFRNKNEEDGLKGANLGHIERMAYDKDPPSDDPNRLASNDSVDKEDALVLSSESPENSLLASLGPGALDNVNLINAQTGEAFNTTNENGLVNANNSNSPGFTPPTMGA